MTDRKLAQGLILLYEDRDMLVVNKPAGLLSIAAGMERDRTAYWILCEYLRKKGEKRRAAVVHRLDRDTSGVMIFVKSEAAKRIFMEAWNTMISERRYIALAEGQFPETSGRIDAPLGEDVQGRMVVKADGLKSITNWSVLQSGNKYTLLALELETGRRNQIRAHLSYLGHPVAGDKKYSAKTNPVNRLALHAERIVFRHPHTNRTMEFDVPAPQSFFTAVGKINRRETGAQQ